MISNHLAIFLAVGVTWWPALLHLQGIVGPAGTREEDMRADAGEVGEGGGLAGGRAAEDGGDSSVHAKS